MRNFTYDYLSEGVAEQDKFEGKPHERLADNIVDLIKRSEKGITIGLQGDWGVGKSTVISLVEQKFKTSSSESGNIHFFYFDAWQHEGDPLRRVFLEKLILKYGIQDKPKLAKLKDRISKKIIERSVSTKRSASPLGTLLAIATFFTPLGLGLLSASNTDHLTLKWTGDINCMFLMGLFLAGSPLTIILGRVMFLIKNGRKVNDISNWPLIQHSSNEETTNETSEEEDKTSVEFEQYFHDIIPEILKDGDKLVLVIDNLDRINSEDALRIWSTLQTFLQHRNPNSQIDDSFQRITTIVPYDESALEKLWDPEIDQQTSNDNGLKRGKKSHSFFEKFFQIRFDVPKPILTSWENLLNEFIATAMKSWKEEDRNFVFTTFKYTRSDLADNPTPRQLKTYVNQVGVLREQVCDTIPIRHICYYVIYRFIERKKVDEISKELVNGVFPLPNDIRVLGQDCRKYFAGLIFGVLPELGIQLLLMPEIKKALSDHNESQINDLVETHGAIVKSVLEYIIDQEKDFDRLFSYGHIMCQEISNLPGFIWCKNVSARPTTSFLIN